MNAKETVQAFWEAMKTNDFTKAARWLSEDFVCTWPQSKEIIEGRENFIRINSEYPASGSWYFRVNTLICENDKVVTDVSVTDGDIQARAITFHTVRNGLICCQTEYWPDDYEAPGWRKKWTRIDDEDNRA